MTRSEATLAREHAALVDTQKMLEHRASTDMLTGLRNRYGFFEAAHPAVEATVGAGRPYSVLILDLDRFKAINDDYGHAAGDDILRSFAETCRQTVRAADVLGRLGGEEFVVLLPDTDAGAASLIAERLRKRVAGDPVMVSGAAEDAPVAVTVSIGLAQNPAGEGLEAVMRRADHALYQAKNGGRDLVKVAA